MVPSNPSEQKQKRGSTGDEAQPPLPVLHWLVWFFHAIARNRLRKAFRAVRLANGSRVPTAEHLVVFLNHASWWDPLVGFLLARFLFPARDFYAPMDAAALKRYGIFRRLGMFPVDMGSSRGAVQFLTSAQAVLGSGSILAITPQGEFTDVRARPVHLRRGLSALLHRRAVQGISTTVLPIAVEYTFWDQRLPEILVNCGDPIHFHGSEAGGAGQIQDALENAMTRAQDELAGLALSRDPSRFIPVLDGDSGSAGFYGLIERLRAALGGNPERGDHYGRNSGTAARISAGTNPGAHELHNSRPSTEEAGQRLKQRRIEQADGHSGPAD